MTTTTMMMRILIAKIVLPVLLIHWFWIVHADSFQLSFSATTTTTTTTTTSVTKPNGKVLFSSSPVNIMAVTRRRDSNDHNHGRHHHHSSIVIDANNKPTTTFSSSMLSSPVLDVTFSLRGGESPSSSESSALDASSAPTTTTTDIIDNNSRASPTGGGTLERRIQKAIIVVTSTIVLYGLFVTRESWVGILFNKDKIQSKTLEILQGLNSLPKVYSYTYYAMGMAFWEAVGLSTIPVETAAGMVFGWDGFFLSGIGKLSGATLAFVLGRYGPLASWIQDGLSKNSFIRLVQDSAADNPFLVTCLFKLSCFPETIKNYGTAVLRPIRLWMFVLGTALHGWTFTALWTYLGVDTAARLRDAALAPNRSLQVLLTIALINGVVVSPLAMGYWARTLQKKARPTVVDGVPTPPSSEG